MESEKPKADSTGCLFIPVGLFTVTAIIYGAYRTFQFLKHGEWPDILLLDVLKDIGIDWASNPQSWLGVYKILAGVSIMEAIAWGVGIFLIPVFLYLLGNKQ